MAEENYIPMEDFASGEVDDLATLTNLTADVLLNELRVRYEKDNIYTFVSDILVAVNPFKTLPIYGADQMEQYKGKTRKEVPPHIYTIADACYHNLFSMKKNQCAVISGESGAGKTESAKFIINYVIELCKAGTYGTNLENQILQVSPILEAFGNAQTNLNRNSSRFGKYTRLLFDAKGSVMGVQLSEYLLEKARVVYQSEGERNFHVFYYIFSHPDLAEYELTSPNDYKVLGGSTWENNKAMLDELIDALRVVGFEDDQLKAVFSVLAACIHLGNVEFVTEGEAVSIKDELPLQAASRILKIPSDELLQSLLGSTTVTRGETIRRLHSADQCAGCTSSLAKILYGSLFGWLVNAINEMLAPELHQKRAAGGRPGMAQRIAPTFEIGVLDIFGFENFAVNSFEQMCINVAHEQLQYFFNHHTFGIELQEYEAEGIDANKVTFKDNGPLLDGFLGRPIGIFSLLDEECSFPQTTDDSFCEKINKNFGEQKWFESQKGYNTSFIIKHFPANVEYQCSNILEKNRDNLNNDIVAVMRQSEITVVQDVFYGEITNTGQIRPRVIDPNIPKKHRGQEVPTEKEGGNKVNRKTPTLSTQFRNSLAVLMERMTACYPHFVRCIKPNMQQQSDNFQDEPVRVQLGYTGVLEATRIRREGYAWRPSFAEFVERYKIIAFPVTKLRMVQANARTSRKILEHAGMENWQIGKTKLFLRYYHMNRMEAALRVFYDGVIKVQTGVRGYLARRLARLLEERKRMTEAERTEAERIELERRKQVELDRLEWQRKEEEKHKAEEEIQLQRMQIEQELAEAEARAQADRQRAVEEEARLALAEAERLAAEAMASETQRETDEAVAARRKAEALAEEARLAREEALRLAEEALLKAEQTEAEMEAMAAAAEEARKAKEAAEEEAKKQKMERQKSRKKRKDDAERMAQEARERAEAEAVAAEEARKAKEAAEEEARRVESERQRKLREMRERQEAEMEEQMKIMEEEARVARELAEKQAKAAEEARLAQEKANEIARKAEQEKQEELFRIAEEKANEEAEARAGDYTRDDFNLALRVAQILESDIPADVIMERRIAKGSLLKVGHHRRHWKKRFFVLDISNMVLNYYDSDKAKKPKGSINLAELLRAFAPNPPNPKEPTLFMIETLQRTFYVQAPSMEALRAWLVALNVVPVHNARTLSSA